MIHIWHALIDFIFPPSVSLLRIREHPLPHLHDFYNEQLIDGVTTLATYQTSLIKACVTAGKFEYNLYALQLLSTLLYMYIEGREMMSPQSTLLVPIPLHRKREQKRGYNQVREVIRYTNKALPEPYTVINLLARTHATPPQSKLGRKERLINLKEAFIYKEKRVDWDDVTEVILIDDVLTTGATMEAARQVLLPHLPKHVRLICVALAH